MNVTPQSKLTKDITNLLANHFNQLSVSYKTRKRRQHPRITIRAALDRPTHLKKTDNSHKYGVHNMYYDVAVSVQD